MIPECCRNTPDVVIVGRFGGSRGRRVRVLQIGGTCGPHTGFMGTICEHSSISVPIVMVMIIVVVVVVVFVVVGVLVASGFHE